MVRKNLHSGFVMQMLLFILLTAALIFIYKPDTKVTSATSPFEMANATASAREIKDKPHRSANRAGNTLTEYDDSAYSSSDLPFLESAEGRGGPVLVISSADNPFSLYTVEILKAEGLNYFAATDISALTASMLSNYDVLIVGEMVVSKSNVAMLTDWVNGGGTLIAFKPGPLLAPLFGITYTNVTLKDKYLLVHTGYGPGAGIVNQTIQYHGIANLYSLKDAISLATLYSTASVATGNPAITVRKVGRNGGSAVAFAYDLAKSIIYTRQGNPRWAGQKRDGQIDPIRSDDMFFPDWVDFNKVAIPQADEQQRLLANIILECNLHRKPLPRFWYLPRDLKAAIVMTGDDHAENGTVGRFNQYLTLGPNTPEDVADWKAIRGTSYIYPNTAMTDAQAAAFEAQGFEIALHPNTMCINQSLFSLQNTFTKELAKLAANFPSISAPVTCRKHCLAWGDWSSTPKAEMQNGIRLDANYYYWPGSWVQNRPGMFTGSGMPMRFADTDGSIIDNYQLVTQMTDESGIDMSNFCNQLLDKAIGAEGYYGVFCANMHTDIADHAGSNVIIASAQAREIPVISAKQLLTWLDGRNNSFFSNINWSKNQLGFKIIAQRGAKNLRAMLPLYAETGQLVSIKMNGNPVSFTTQTIKGIQYAFFSAAMGNNAYTADYSGSFLKTPEKVVAKNENVSENKWNNPLHLLQYKWDMQSVQR